MLNVKFKKALLRLDFPWNLFQDGSYPVLTNIPSLVVHKLFVLSGVAGGTNSEKGC